MNLPVQAMPFEILYVEGMEAAIGVYGRDWVSESGICGGVGFGNVETDNDVLEESGRHGASADC